VVRNFSNKFPEFDLANTGSTVTINSVNAEMIKYYFEKTIGLETLKFKTQAEKLLVFVLPIALRINL
jgi:hypothetical protein